MVNDSCANWRQGNQEGEHLKGQVEEIWQEKLYNEYQYWIVVLFLDSWKAEINFLP